MCTCMYIDILAGISTMGAIDGHFSWTYIYLQLRRSLEIYEWLAKIFWIDSFIIEKWNEWKQNQLIKKTTHIHTHTNVTILAEWKMKRRILKTFACDRRIEGVCLNRRRDNQPMGSQESNLQMHFLSAITFFKQRKPWFRVDGTTNKWCDV